MILVPMVEEKGCGVKEFLRIASAQSYLNNMTFFFTNLLIGCIIFGTTLILAACYQLLAHIATFWIVVLLFLYLASAIAFTFLLSVAFDSGRFSPIVWRSFKSIFPNFQMFQLIFIQFYSLLRKNRWISLLHRTIFDCFIQWQDARPNIAGIQFSRFAQGFEFVRYLWQERWVTIKFVDIYLRSITRIS